MRNMRRFPVVGAFVVLMMVGFGASPGTAQSRAHVYLLRGLMNIFSLGMDTLAEEISAAVSTQLYTTTRNGGRSLTVLPPPIAPAEKARSSLLGIRLALMR